MKLSPTLLGVFGVALLSAPARPDALPPPIVPQCVGVNIHFTGAPARDLDGLQAGGFGWVRMDFAWSAIETVKGRYDFAAYDALVAGLTARHIKPLFILDYGNDLYQAGAPRTPEARAAFARFAAASVTHFKGRPILWEIWNEPNGGFWKPQANADEYGRLALETARAIKQADPNATVLAPGTAGIPLDFLETAFRTGLLRYVDAVSLHPYRQDRPESAAADFPAVRLLIQKYAPQGKQIPLVSSEWGYTAVTVSEEQQGQYLAREWLSNLAEGVRLSIWYDWHDDGVDPKEGEHHFGTVHNDYLPKPAFLAAQKLTRALGGYRFVKRLPLASAADYLLLFSDGKSVKTASWTAGEGHAARLPGGRSLALSGSPQYGDAGGDAAQRAAASWSVSAASEFYAAGQTPALALTYQSADGHRHRVQTFLAVSVPGEAPRSITGPAAPVAPGRALRQTIPVSGLSRVAARARVSLALDGVRQPYSQEVTFAPTDPLGLSVTPLTGAAVLVHITNPAGTPFVGRLSDAPGIARLVRLAAGQTGLDVSLPRPPRGAECVLWDAQGRTVTHLPLTRFVPYAAALPLFRAVLDGDTKLPSTVSLDAASTPPGGGAALRVDYQFAPGWSFARVAEARPTALPGRPLGLGLWIYGDGGSDLARLRFRDASGQTFQANGLAIDWSGWRFVAFPLVPRPGEAAVAHWGGANDGRVQYPVSVDTLFLLDSVAGARRHSGRLWIKQPTVIYGAAE